MFYCLICNKEVILACKGCGSRHYCEECYKVIRAYHENTPVSYSISGYFTSGFKFVLSLFSGSYVSRSTQTEPIGLGSSVVEIGLEPKPATISLEVFEAAVENLREEKYEFITDLVKSVSESLSIVELPDIHTNSELKTSLSQASLSSTNSVKIVFDRFKSQYPFKRLSQ